MVLPDGRCDIIVRSNINAPEQITPIITGPATQAYQVTFEKGDQWHGIRLRPEKGGALWQFELKNIADNTLRGEQACARFPNLRNLSASDLSLGSLEDAVSTHTWPNNDKRLIKAINLVHASGGRTRIEDLALRVACSPRHLTRLFRKHVGLSPKVYAQIAQFHRTLKLITSGQLTVTAAAYEGGYADHAHLTRAFHRFGGFAPSKTPNDLALPKLFLT